jgi:hypothetical protein
VAVLDRRTRRVIEDLLTTFEPPTERGTFTEQQLAVIGLFQGARRTAKALLILGGSDLDDAGDGLARSMLEYAATAGWIARDPRTVERLKDAYAYDWTCAQQDWEKKRPTEPFPYPNDLAILSRSYPAPKVSLPRFQDRAREAELLPYLNAYRMFSLTVHPTFVAVGFGLSDRRRPSLRSARFALAAASLVHLAEALNRLLSLGWGPNIARIQQQMMAHFAGGPGS